MDFMNRGASQQPAHNQPNNDKASASVSAKGESKFQTRKLVKAGSFVLLLLITALVAALLIVIATSKTTDPSENEAKLVNSANMQAVFLTNGQVYFGHIKSVDSQSIQLSDIYYLTTNTQVQPNTNQASAASNTGVQLVKLGCELHAPEDSMTINRSQVTFWENLKTTGQVAAAVKTYKDQNPGAQNCSTSSTTDTTGTGTTTTTKQ
ncbi:MAG: hypothetical protein JWM37_48 [Candidatus Saccharibacteria bacterium]|nr:hypothetical protein [Candidatus Saccharibacteria bacterium]